MRNGISRYGICHIGTLALICATSGACGWQKGSACRQHAKQHDIMQRISSL